MDQIKWLSEKKNTSNESWISQDYVTLLLSDTILQAEDHQIGCLTCFHHSQQANYDKINKNEIACLNQFDLREKLH